MIPPPGIRVRFRALDGWVDYPEATTAMVGPGGAFVVLRGRRRRFPEALDEIPAERWWSWEHLRRGGCPRRGRPVAAATPPGVTLYPSTDTAGLSVASAHQLYTTRFSSEDLEGR